jgi:hypothetical protein
MPLASAERAWAGAVASVWQAAVADFDPVVPDEHGDRRPAAGAAFPRLGCSLSGHDAPSRSAATKG